MEKCFVDRESSLLQERQNRMDVHSMLNEFIQEDLGAKKFDQSVTEQRRDRIKEIIKKNRSLRQQNEEIMDDFKQIRNPTTFEEYKKYSFRRWVGNEGKYIVPKTH